MYGQKKNSEKAKEKSTEKGGTDGIISKEDVTAAVATAGTDTDTGTGTGTGTWTETGTTGMPWDDDAIASRYRTASVAHQTLLKMEAAVKSDEQRLSQTAENEQSETEIRDDETTTATENKAENKLKKSKDLGPTTTAGTTGNLGPTQSETNHTPEPEHQMDEDMKVVDELVLGAPNQIGSKRQTGSVELMSEDDTMDTASEFSAVMFGSV